MSIGKYNSDGNIYSVAEANEKFSSGGGDISELEKKVQKNTDDITNINTDIDDINDKIDGLDVDSINQRLDGVAQDISDINSVIPSGVSTTNKLVDNNTLLDKTGMLFGGDHIFLNNWNIFYEGYYYSQDDECLVYASYSDILRVACEETSGNFYRSNVMQIPLPSIVGFGHHSKFVGEDAVYDIQLTGGHRNYPVHPVLESVDLENQVINYYWLSGGSRAETGNYKIFCNVVGRVNKFPD